MSDSSNAGPGGADRERASGPVGRPSSLPPPTSPPHDQPAPTLGAPQFSSPPPSPAAAVPGAEPWSSPDAATVSIEPTPPRRRSTGSLVAAIVGVVALVAAGAFAIVAIAGGDDDGGAASPSDVGNELIAALDDEDVLGVVDLLLPSERDALRQPLVDLVEDLKRLDVLSDEASLDDVAGVDLQFEDVTVREDPTNVDDITNISISGTSTATVQGEEVPLGDLLIDAVFDGDRPDLDQRAESAEFEDVRLTTVERDGRWYLSGFYSIAEQARGDRDIPEDGVLPQGAREPEGAVDAMIEAIIDQQVETVVALLDPSEAEALQRYAPLFLPDAEAAVDDVTVDITVSDIEYSVEGEGERRSVGIDSFELSIADTGSGEAASVTYEDGCLVLTGWGEEPTEMCGSSLGSLDELLGQSGLADEDAARELLDAISDAFEDHDPSGIAVHEVDELWYVSPLRTYFDGFDSVLDALDRSEIDRIIDASGELMEDLRGSTDCVVFGDTDEEPPADDGCSDGSFEG